MSGSFLVVMGVAGTGKTEIGQRLAAALDAPFLEADRLHSPENVEKMRGGTGLTDEDRWPWLEAVCAAAIDQKTRPVVIACSVLKRRYRDLLRERLGSVRFLFLEGSKELIAERLGSRKGHFASISLLESQLAALEPPADDEEPIRLDIRQEPQAIVEDAIRELGGTSSGEQ